MTDTNIMTYCMLQTSQTKTPSTRYSTDYLTQPIYTDSLPSIKWKFMAITQTQLAS